jgi:hypothetical protein
MTIYQSHDHHAHSNPDSPQSRADATYNGVCDHPGAPDEPSVEELLSMAEQRNVTLGSNWQAISVLIAAVRKLANQ